MIMTMQMDTPKWMKLMTNSNYDRVALRSIMLTLVAPNISQLFDNKFSEFLGLEAAAH